MTANARQCTSIAKWLEGAGHTHAATFVTITHASGPFVLAAVLTARHKSHRTHLAPSFATRSHANLASNLSIIYCLLARASTNPDALQRQGARERQIQSMVGNLPQRYLLPRHMPQVHRISSIFPAIHEITTRQAHSAQKAQRLPGKCRRPRRLPLAHPGTSYPAFARIIIRTCAHCRCNGMPDLHICPWRLPLAHHATSSPATG